MYFIQFTVFVLYILDIILIVYCDNNVSCQESKPNQHLVWPCGLVFIFVLNLAILECSSYQLSSGVFSNLVNLISTRCQKQMALAVTGEDVAYCFLFWDVQLDKFSEDFKADKCSHNANHQNPWCQLTKAVREMLGEQPLYACRNP